MPVRAVDRQEGRVVLVAGDHECGGGHRGEAGGQEEGVVLDGELGQGVAAPAGRGEQYARLDPRVGQVHFGSVVGIGEAGAQQQARGVPAHGVPDDGDPAPVETSGALRNGFLDGVELVEDARHVLGPGTPVRGGPRGVGVQAQRPGVQVGGLDDDETPCGPEVG